jgi:hypothetical protein
MLLFYSPLSASESVMPAGGANAATPAFALNNIVSFTRNCVAQVKEG